MGEAVGLGNGYFGARAKWVGLNTNIVHLKSSEGSFLYIINYNTPLSHFDSFGPFSFRLHPFDTLEIKHNPFISKLVGTATSRGVL